MGSPAANVRWWQYMCSTSQVHHPWPPMRAYKPTLHSPTCHACPATPIPSSACPGPPAPPAPPPPAQVPGLAAGSPWNQKALDIKYPPLKEDASPDVVVIGAGISGLSCALSLAKAGMSGGWWGWG